MGKDLKGKTLPRGISQRADGRYQARFTDRWGRRKAIYGKSLKQVEKKLNELKYKDGAGETLCDDITLDEWFAQWMPVYVEESNLSLSTKYSYKKYYENHVKDRIGNQKLSSIKALHIKSLFSEMAQEDDLGASTISGIKGMLSNMFKSAMENELLNRNPTQNVKVPNIKPKRENIALTVLEQELLLNECQNSEYGNFIMAQLGSGLRCGELASLKLSNLDLEKNIIRLTNTIAYRNVNGKMGYFLTKPKTKTSVRNIPMTRLFRTAIEAEMEKGIELAPKYRGGELEGLIFLTPKGAPVCPQYYDTALKKLISEINQKSEEQLPMFSSHTLRHTYCSRLVERGVNVKAVQTIMGHSNIRQTMERYAHINEDYLLEILDDIDDIF